MSESDSSSGSQAPGDRDKERPGGAWWKKTLTVLADEPIDDADVAERTFPEAAAPAELVCNLLPFQRESLYWMTNQERSTFRGGILADEMGLGKTVQSIALILANRTDPVTGATCVAPPRDFVSDGLVAVLKASQKAAAKAAKKEMAATAKAAKRAAGRGRKGGDDEPEDAVAPPAAPAPASSLLAELLQAPPSPHAPPELVAAAAPIAQAWSPLVPTRTALNSLAPPEPCRATLVICPVVALSQWRAEIARHTAPGALSVLVYHGASRSLSADAVAAYDVVLTTYSTLEVEFRKMIAPTKVTCKWCERLFLPEKMPVHLRYFCGPDAVKTSAQAKQERKRAPRAGGGGDSEDDDDDEEEDGAVIVSDSSDEPTPRRTAGAKRSRAGGVDAAAAAMSVAAAAVASAQPRGGSGGKRPAPPAAGSTWSGAATAAASVAAAAASASEPAPFLSTPRSKARAAGVASSGAKSSKAGGRSPSTGGSRSRPSAARAPPPPGSDDSEDSEFSAPGDNAADEEEEASSSDGGDASSGDSSPQAVAGAARGGRGRGGSAARGGGGRKERAPRKPRAPRERSRGRAAPAAGASASATPSGASEAASAPVEPLKLGPLSLLQRIHWRRVILDEAHAIKNKQSTTAKAAFHLTAERRWCLSGTPLQNRVGELFSLTRFLCSRPFTYYYCKNCPCTSVEYRLDAGGRHCALCGHSPMRHFNWLNRFVLNPIKQYGYAGPGRDAMALLRREVLDGLLLRRTKASRAADLSLPSRTILLRDDLELDLFEKDYYEALYTQSRARFDAYVANATVSNNYAHLFDLLTRLRQAVCHPYLVQYGHASVAAAAAAAAAAASEEDGAVEAEGGSGGVCGICREAVEDAVVTGCRHTFCRLCVREYLEGIGGCALSMLRDATTDAAADDCSDALVVESPPSAAGKKPRKQARTTPSSSPAAAAGSGGGGGGGPAPTCPSCLAPLTVDLQSSSSGAASSAHPTASPSSSSKSKSILARLPAARVGGGFRSSSKIEALLEELWRAQAEEPGCKALVFSQFVNFLDLIQHRLTRAGVRCVKLDGGMSVAARDRVIGAFREDPFVTVFLISLKAGGVALNLTPASRIFLMDCWWNVAAEMQAMDRTHRLGQHRTITVVRFVVRNTIEERIVALQEKKRLVFDSTVGKDDASLSKLTDEDMRFLFS